MAVLGGSPQLPPGGCGRAPACLPRWRHGTSVATGPPLGGQWGVPWGSPTVCVVALPPAGCERTEKYGRSVSYALRRLDEETPFVFHYADSEFFPKSSFSALKFELNAYTDDQYVTQSAVCPSGLFAFGARPEHFEALKFIHCSRSHPWPVLPPERKKTKREVMLSIASRILMPLCREVVLEKGYRRALEERPVPGLECDNIGMGTVHTWHGTPDARVRGAEVVYRRETDEMYEVSQAPSDDESDAASDGATTTVEAKVMTKDANLHQAVGTCVVSSFTEKSLHPDLNALVPTIIIDEKQFRVCLYNSEKDILLISKSKCLATNGGLSRSGMALLWLTLNHR